jgi:hypothetical protein
VTIDVFPTIAPNVSSVSGAVWSTNAVDTIYTTTAAGASYATMTGGTIGTPTYFSRAPSTIQASDMFVTAFNSWNGRSDPEKSFGDDFADENGNRLHFSVLVQGNGQKISLSQLSFVLTSSDAGNVLGIVRPTGWYNYNENYVGIDFGTDGHIGGGDDVFVKSGTNTQEVDMLVGRGTGNAWEPLDASGDPKKEQQAIDALAASIASETPILVTGTYTLSLDGVTTITGTNNVTVIPEPSTYAALLALGSLGIALWARRYKAIA